MRIGIDIGGTFTDFIAFDEEEGVINSYKILSTPRDPADAVFNGLEHFSPGEWQHVIHGSTVATNALLERKGARIALITTRGFRDVIAIGRQVRKELYNLLSTPVEPIVQDENRLEVTERVDHTGKVLNPLKEDEIPKLIKQLKTLEVESVAICLLFSFMNPDHEQMLARAIRKEGFFVSSSSEILPEFREYGRTSTTAINAYVAPIVDSYIQQLGEKLDANSFHIMQSNGGSIRADRARTGAVRSILSGPAGGVVGAFHVAKVAGFDQIISFDMGGTSTDVSLCDGAIQVTTEAEIGGFPIRIPVIDIHTVGSGGGSIAYVDSGGALRVGPLSAGADPGPACYGRGGKEPTVTDANLVLGRLAPDHFLGGRMALHSQASEVVLEKLGQQAGLTPQVGLTMAQTAALGVVQVVNAHMERALRVMSVERGHDPHDFTLVSFGGAGGLHASNLARDLGIPRVLISPFASTMSAFGMITADAIKDYVQTVMLPGDTTFEHLEGLIVPLIDQSKREMTQDGVPMEQITFHRDLDMRYVGQGYELQVPLTPDFTSEFHKLHLRTYRHSAPEAPIEIVNLRLRAVGRVSRPMMPRIPIEGEDPSESFIEPRPFVQDNGEVTPEAFYNGERLRPGNVIHGPAVSVYEDTTVYLPRGDRARVDEYLNLMVEVGSET